MQVGQRNLAACLSIAMLLAACGGGGAATAADTTPLAVTSVTPVNSAPGIDVVRTVSISFSEALDCSTVNATSVRLGDVFSSLSGTVDCSGNSVTFIPASALPYNTQFTLEISTDVRDSAGNALNNAYASSFTTYGMAFGADGAQSNPSTVY